MSRKFGLRLFLVIPLLGFWVSCVQNRPARDLAQAKQTRHILVFVHGIGGDTNTFGAMPEFLENKLYEKSQGSIKVEAIKYLYSSQVDNVNSMSLAQGLASFMRSHLATHPLEAGDKISIIAHSQGGLVGLIWAFQASVGNKDFAPELAPFVSDFVSLGTPYWGAKAAIFTQWLKKQNFPFKKSLKNLGFDVNLSKSQLSEMTYGSNTIYEFRRTVFDDAFGVALKQMNEKIRFLAIAGWLHGDKKINGPDGKPTIDKTQIPGPFMNGLYLESDGLVETPSARFDFLAVQDFNWNYSDQETADFATREPERPRFQKLDGIPYKVVDAFHAPIPLKRWQAIAFVPESCVSESFCNHDAARMVLQHIANEPLDDGLDITKATSFGIDLNLRLPPGYVLEEDDIEIQYFNSRFKQASYFKEKGLVIDPYTEIKSRMVRKGHAVDDKTGERFNALRVYISGLSKGQVRLAEDGKRKWKIRDVEIWIKAHGFRTRRIKLPIRPTYTTFADLTFAADPTAKPKKEWVEQPSRMGK